MRAFLVLGVLLAGVFGVSALADTQSSLDSQDANGFFSGGSTRVDILASHTDFIFTADDGTQTERVATIVRVFYFSSEDNFFGCYVIPDEDFVVQEKLHSATLQTTLSGPSNCGRVDRADGEPVNNEGPGPGPGLAVDLQINVQWNYYGVVGEQTSQNADSCGAYAQQSATSGRYAFSAGIGRVASTTRFATAPRLAASFGRLSTTHNDFSITGVRSLACGGIGFFP